MSDDLSKAGASPGRRWWSLFLKISLAIVLLAATLPTASVSIFGQFARYDDEGYMMMTVKHLVDGRAMYDQVATLYGPFYYLVQWLLHSILRVPLTNDAIRLVSIAFWIATCGLLAFCALEMTGRVALAALVYGLSFFYLRILVEGPGHPQELSALLLALCVVAALAADRGRRIWLPVGLGAAAAALVLTKINVGVLATLSLLLATAAASGRPRALTAVAAVAALLLPFVVVRSFLNTAWGLSFPVMIALALLALLTASRPSRHASSRYHDVSLIGSALVVAAGAIGFVMARGTTVRGLIDSMIVMPQRVSLPGGPMIPIVPWAVLPAVASLGVAALYVARVRNGATEPRYPDVACLAMGKLAFGLLVLLKCLQCDSWALVNYATPWLWLGLVPLPRLDRSPATPAARAVVCFLAALQPFQVYPVPGAQSYFGTFLMILVGSVCVSDGLDWALEWLGARSGAVVWRRAGLPLVVILLALLCARRWQTAAAIYRSRTPLALSGAEWIRVPAAQASTYQRLCTSLKNRADTFICSTGFNSMYFWTQIDPPCPLVIGNNLDIFTKAQQATIVASLDRFPHPCAVYHPSFFLKAEDPAHSGNLVLKTIANDYTTVERIGNYEVKIRASKPAERSTSGTAGRHDGPP